MPLCDTCARRQTDGTYKCPVCSISGRVPGTSQVPEALRPRIPMNSPLVAMPCAVHPEMTTTVRCDGCGTYVCETCDFKLQGNLHACPTCAMSSPTGLSSSRKKLVIAGILLAIWSTVALVLLLTGYFADGTTDQSTLGIVVMFIVFLPTLIGFTVSLCAQESRLHNPVAVWIAVVWNSMLLLGLIAIVAIGLMMRA